MLMMLALISPQTRLMFMMLVSCGGWGGGVGGGRVGLVSFIQGDRRRSPIHLHDMMLKREGWVGGGVGGGWGGAMYQEELAGPTRVAEARVVSSSCCIT